MLRILRKNILNNNYRDENILLLLVNFIFVHNYQSFILIVTMPKIIYYWACLDNIKDCILSNFSRGYIKEITNDNRWKKIK